MYFLLQSCTFSGRKLRPEGCAVKAQSWTPARTFPIWSWRDSLPGRDREEREMRQAGLFGLSEHLERLSKHGDPLEVLEATVDFEHFRPWLVEGLGRGDGSRGGRPPFDAVVRPAHSDRWRSGPHCSRR
jgi:hypothetical protein